MSERAIAVQRGEAPAETFRELVDAIRQDTAGAGACASSLRYLSEKWPEAARAPLLAWIERLELHLERLDAKCSLAVARDTLAGTSGDD